MVNRKAVIIASTVAAVLVAAAVVVAVMFTVVYPNGVDGPPAAELAIPNPGMKRTDSQGVSASKGSNDTWVMTYIGGTDLNAVKSEMESAGMPWEIKKVDSSLGYVIMSCDESMVPMAAQMNINARRGRYLERLVLMNITQRVPWGLDRVDQVNLPLSNTFNTGELDGTGVDVHILDTGVNGAHTAFGGRVLPGYDAFPNDNSPANADCQGHGTHVAGTVAGNTYGIARGAQIYGSQVLGCDGSGSTRGITDAINWVANLQTSRRRVINMSLGGGASTLLDQAVANAVTKGVVVVVAAGNENQDACNVSPAREPTAITVVASDSSDRRASFSNYGRCTDIVAPGVDIISASNVDNTGTKTMSGTSMASPHVAGVAALFVQACPECTPQQIRDRMVNAASKGLVSGLSADTPNALLYWDPSTTSGTPTTEASTTTETTETPTSNPDAPDDGTTIVKLNLPEQGAATVPADGTGYYTSNGPGLHQGKLVGAGGTDFDLYLYKWTGSNWAIAAQSTSPQSTETVTYNSDQNIKQYYIWQVASYTGAGEATLEYSAPE